MLARAPTLRIAAPRALARAFGVAAALIALTCAPDASASAIERIAKEVAQALGEVPAATQVVAGPLVTDVPAPKGEELAVRIAALFAARVGKGARPHERALSLPAARALAKQAPALLYLTPSIEKGQLRIVADLYSVARNRWDRVKTPVPAPRAHAFASNMIDAEVRAFLPPVLLEQAAIMKARVDEPEILAAACGDLDGDGGLEIALVSRAKISVGRFRGGKFAVDRAASWSTLTPKVAVPLREPIATAAVVEDDRLLVGTTDRGGVALDRELSLVARLRGLPIDSVGLEACASLLPEASALEGAANCSTILRTKDPMLPLPVPRFDAAAAATVVGRDGVEQNVVAAREPGGRVRVRFGNTETEGKPIEAGAELAVYDLDLDGIAELATSLDSPTEEAIMVYTVARGAEPRLRRKIATSAPVRALAACPPEAGGVPGLVAVVGSEVWLVR